MLIMTTASSSAAWTALRTNRMPSAATTMIGARIQKVMVGVPSELSCGGAQRGRTRTSWGGSSGRPPVVVTFVVAEPHRVRRLLHAGQQRGEQVGLLVDQVGSVVVGQLVLVGHRQRPGRARLDAQPAQDAAQVVDLVDAAVALTGAEALVLGVGRALDVDRVGRAGPGAQLAPDALLQPVRPAVQLVPTVEPRRGGQLLEGVLLGDDLLEHGPEGHPEARDRVPELLLHAARLRLGLGHQISSPEAATVEPVGKDSGRAAPRTAPPDGIGGTGNPPAWASKGSGAGSGSSSCSPMKNSARKSTARMPIPMRRYCRLTPPSSEIERMVATAMIHTSEIGISRFQPNAMNWS